jgi:hypothetical protein
MICYSPTPNHPRSRALFKLNLHRFLIVLLVLSPLWASASERRLRSFDPSRIVIPEKSSPRQADQDTVLLKYDGSPRLPNFWTLPNEYNDNYYNVRFTPTFAPYWLLGVYVAILDPPERVSRSIGDPGMSVHVWESGEQDGVEGYPGRLIDSVIVEPAEMQFVYWDSTGRNIDSGQYNFVDLRWSEIGFNDRLDFLVGISLIADTTEDTLMLLIDDAARPTNRSCFWNGTDTLWVRLIDQNGINRGHNMAIMALIADELSVASGELLFPDGVRLSSAFPNPFNSSTTVEFSVPSFLPYQAQLFDGNGRMVRTLGQGFGGGGVLKLDAGSLQSGTYFIILNTPETRQSQRVILIR